jgi:hypothetical protein
MGAEPRNNCEMRRRSDRFAEVGKWEWNVVWIKEIIIVLLAQFVHFS